VNVAVVEATGLVGPKIVEALAHRNFPVDTLRLFAAPTQLGKVLHFRNAAIRLEPLTDEAVRGAQLAFFFASDNVCQEWVPKFVGQGATVIDHSTASRLDPKIPTVVAGVNSQDVRKHRGVIATPNCATVQLALALKPLHDAFTIRRAVITTFQAASGAGAQGIADLEDEARSLVFDDRVFKREVFPRQLAMNVIPQIPQKKAFVNGETIEEKETAAELGRLLPGVKVAVTCVRVGVKNAHAASVNLEFERPVKAPLDVLRNAPHMVLKEKDEEFPTPAEVSGRGEVFVGRVRQDHTVSSGLSLWVVADNLLRGTSLNAVEIAEILVEQ
jgi:aspartate-semialdehyde dehydrogenase